MPAKMSDFATAFASLKAAKDAAEAMAKATDAAARQQHQTEILSQIADAYNAVLSAREERSALLDRIRELESLAEMRERYKLVSLGAVNVVAYAPKHPEPGEPSHYLCATCLHAGKVHFLQQTTSGEYHDKYTCKACGELSVDKGVRRQRSALPPGRGSRGPHGWMAS